jgi:hypothetical protein
MLIKISFYNDDENEKQNIYQAVESVPNSNRKIQETEATSTPLHITHIDDRLLS